MSKTKLNKKNFKKLFPPKLELITMKKLHFHFQRVVCIFITVITFDLKRQVLKAQSSKKILIKNLKVTL